MNAALGFARDGVVFDVCFGDAANGNRISNADADRMVAALAELPADVHLVRIRSNGPAFCLGHVPNESAETAHRPLPSHSRGSRAGARDRRRRGRRLRLCDRGRVRSRGRDRSGDLSRGRARRRHPAAARDDGDERAHRGENDRAPRLHARGARRASGARGGHRFGGRAERGAGRVRRAHLRLDRRGAARYGASDQELPPQRARRRVSAGRGGRRSPKRRGRLLRSLACRGWPLSRRSPRCWPLRASHPRRAPSPTPGCLRRCRSS